MKLEKGKFVLRKFTGQSKMELLLILKEGRPTFKNCIKQCFPFYHSNTDEYASVYKDHISSCRKDVIFQLYSLSNKQLDCWSAESLKYCMRVF